jgi:hypothetical protein
MYEEEGEEMRRTEEKAVKKRDKKTERDEKKEQIYYNYVCTYIYVYI